MDMALKSRSREVSPVPGGEQGLSLIEVMFASLLFLAVALGVVPMFTQSMVSNSSGNDSTKAANFARARAEELTQYPFNHPDLTIDAGSEKIVEEYYGTDSQWHLYPIPDGDTAQWSRTTIVRQYNVDALDDDRVEMAEALAAGSDPSFIHLKEIQVRVEQGGSVFTSLAKTITVRTLRAH
jgi:Tfp pilus assembly protein PilV